MSLNRSSRSSNTLSMDFDSRTSSNKSKFIKDRVTHVENSFGSLCGTFGAIARKNGNLRDKHDELSQHLLEYSENITYNSSSRAALSQVSRELASCNDYQDALVKRVETHVVEPLRIFDTVIKNSREEIQSAFNAYDKEQKSKKAVDSMREKNPSDRHKLNQAETELHKAQVHASRSAKALEEAIDSFEDKKLADLKMTLGNYIRIQMSYHAKNLEALTKAYRALSVLDPEEDLEEFRNILHPSSAIERQQMMRSVGGGSRQSLTSQMSAHSLRSSGSRSATPKQRMSPQRTPTGRVDMFSAKAAAKTDMFTASSAQSTAKTSQRPSPQRPPARPSMLGDEDDDSDSEDDDDLSGSDLQEAEPGYASIDKLRR